MTSNRDIFIDYEDFKLTVGTAKADVNLSFVGRGKVCCPINGINTIFDRALHISEPLSNLSSSGKLTSAGLSVGPEAECVTISWGNKFVAKGSRVGDTWILRAGQKNELAYKAGPRT